MRAELGLTFAETPHEHVEIQSLQPLSRKKSGRTIQDAELLQAEMGGQIGTTKLSWRARQREALAKDVLPQITIGNLHESVLPRSQRWFDRICRERIWSCASRCEEVS